MAYLEQQLAAAYESLAEMPGDQTVGIANQGITIEFTHIPTGHSTKFKAMITNFSDQFTSEWASETPYGRMDPIQNFKRTGRVLSFDFDIPSSNPAEALMNLRRISTLIQFLYPTYDKGGGVTASSIKGSPIVKIKFLNWIMDTSGGQGLHGTLDGLTFQPDMQMGVHEDYTFGEGTRTIAPKLLKVSCRLTVLNNHALGWKGKSHRSTGFKDYPYNVSGKYSHFSQDESNSQNSNPPGGDGPAPQATVTTTTLCRKANGEWVRTGGIIDRCNPAAGLTVHPGESGGGPPPKPYGSLAIAQQKQLENVLGPTPDVSVYQGLPGEIDLHGSTGRGERFKPGTRPERVEQNRSRRAIHPRDGRTPAYRFNEHGERVIISGGGTEFNAPLPPRQGSYKPISVVKDADGKIISRNGVEVAGRP